MCSLDFKNPAFLFYSEKGVVLKNSFLSHFSIAYWNHKTVNTAVKYLQSCYILEVKKLSATTGILSCD